MFAGQAITGGSLSLTVTVKLHVFVLPLVSVAVQVTVFMPLAKALPLAGVQLAVTPEQLSVAVAAKFTIRLHWPGAVFVTIFAGQVTTGASLSLTVTVKLQLVEFPNASVAVQLTAVIPLAKALPFVGVQLTVTPGQLSVAVAAKPTIWLHWPGAVFVARFAGQVIVGASVSLTRTVKVQVAVLPEAPVAVQVTVLVPLAKTLPLVGLQLTLTPAQLSVAVAVKLTVWLH